MCTWHVSSMIHQRGTLSTESIPFQWRFCDLAGRSEVGVLFFRLPVRWFAKGILLFNIFFLLMNQRFLSISYESMDYEVQTLNHLNLKVICLIIESVESETYVFQQGSNHVEALSTTFSRKKSGLFFSESWRDLQKRCSFLPWDGHRIID